MSPILNVICTAAAMVTNNAIASWLMTRHLLGRSTSLHACYLLRATTLYLDSHTRIVMVFCTRPQCIIWPTLAILLPVCLLRLVVPIFQTMR